MIRKLPISFEKIKKVNYLFRNYDLFIRNMTCPKKVNYLVRKYDLFTQEYAKVTPTWDELTFLNALGELALTVRFWGGGGRGGGDFFNRFQTLLIVLRLFCRFFFRFIFGWIFNHLGPLLTDSLMFRRLRALTLQHLFLFDDNIMGSHDSTQLKNIISHVCWHRYLRRFVHRSFKLSWLPKRDPSEHLAHSKATF